MGIIIIIIQQNPIIIYYRNGKGFVQQKFCSYFNRLKRATIIVKTHLVSSTDPDTHVITLPKAELDIANEDTKHYPPNFEVCVMYFFLQL